VSIVMPAYNAAAHIRPALESAFAQDYEPFEVIVVDDGSTDDTAEIVRSFAGAIYVRQENQGPAAARNTAVAHAHGELIANLDSDDLLPPTRLSVQVAYLLEHPEIGAVFGRQEWLNPPAWLARDVVYGDLDGIPLSSIMLRREVFEALGGYDTRFEPSEDMDLVVRMRERGIPYAVLPDIVLHRRHHETSLTNGRQASHEPLLRSLHAKLARERSRG
jgi:glycosyltransferase involved in cell wall biosynthesis